MSMFIFWACRLGRLRRRAVRSIPPQATGMPLPSLTRSYTHAVPVRLQDYLIVIFGDEMVNLSSWDIMNSYLL
jgi:hypothetical protein